MTRFIVLSLLIISASIAAFSQQAANATLNGTILDQAGAVIAGTKITATQIATGVTRDSVSNETGFYVFSNMPPGQYELKFEGPAGFAASIQKSVSLNVGQTVTLNVTLEIDKTLINADPIIQPRPLIDNTNSVIDGLIISRDVESLPLNGRNFLELALLIPGNSPAPNFDPTK